MRFNQAQELIEKLQNENVMQFALPRRGRGFVKKNGELLLYTGGTLTSYGHFQEDLKNNGAIDHYHFIYQYGGFDIPEVISVKDGNQAKDLMAFAIKLSYFFVDHPKYKNERGHDLDVLFKYDENYKLDTPLTKAGFRIS